MEDNHFGLIARGQEFEDLIKSTTCTNTYGENIAIEKSFHELVDLVNHNRDTGNAVYVIGNGGSAAVASHAITDFINVCRLRAFTLHESSLMTCMANDFGYEQAFKRIIETVMRPNDMLIAISSSGKSANICNAAKMAASLGCTVITLSGFQADNPLRKLGHYNFWLNSNDYGLVEIGHLFLLHNLADRDRVAIALKDQAKMFADVSA